MSTYLVIYDNINSSDKESFLRRLYKYTPRCGFKKCMIIQTSQTAEQVRDHLQAAIYSDDYMIFVTKLSQGAAWFNLPNQDKFNKVFKSMKKDEI